MAISVCEVSITELPLVLPGSRDDPATGAVVDFWGLVRSFEAEREIDGIQYEAHLQMAEHQMLRIANEAAKQFGLRRVLIMHRIGWVPAGEASIVVRVESSHRAEAFRSNQWIMDEVKRTTPIWKHPVFKAGPSSEKSGPDDGLTQSRPSPALA